MRRRFRACLLPGLVLWLSACAFSVGAPSGPAATAPPAGLPSLLALQRDASAYSEGDRRRDGSGYDDALPNQHVSRSGMNVLFNPSGDTRSPDGFAYCIYGFSLPGYVDAPELKLAWDVLPDPPPEPKGKLAAAAGPLPPYWVALANFETGRWDILDGTYDGLIPIPLAEGVLPLGPYRDVATGHVFAAIITAYPGCSLRAVLLGRPGWVHTWATPFQQSGDYAAAWDLDVDPEGNVYVVHFQNYGTSDDGSTLLKYDAQGRLLWQRRVSLDGVKSKLALGPSGVIVSTGVYYEGRVATTGISPDGDVLWQKSFAHPASLGMEIADAVTNGSGGVLALLHINTLDVTPDGYLLLEYSSEGDLLLARDIIPDPSLLVSNPALACTADAIYIAGSPNLLRLDRLGAVIWQFDLGGISCWNPCLTAGADTWIYLAANSGSYAYVARISPDASLSWCRRFSDPLDPEFLTSISPAEAGLYTIINLYDQAVVVYLGLDGAVQQEQVYGFTGSTFAHAVTTDSDGNLYLAGAFDAHEPYVNNWGQHNFDVSDLSPALNSATATVADSAGSENDEPLVWQPYAGIEDRWEAGVVVDHPAFILRRD